MKTFRIGDESVVIRNIVSIGDVKAVRVNSGKGKDLVERTVYNFLVKAGFHVFKTDDFETEQAARGQRDWLIEGLPE